MTHLGLPSKPDLPRDGTIVCQDPERGKLYQGRRVVCAPDVAALGAAWSEVCRRYPAVVVDGDEDYHATVSYLCHVTACNTGNTVRRGKSWIRHLVGALPHMHVHPTVEQMRGAYKGLPAFVVGAGPSLDADRYVLPELHRYGLTIGVNAGSAATRCHVALTNESNDQSGKTKPGDAVLAIGPQAHPKVRHEAKRVMWLFAGELGELVGKALGKPVLPGCASSSSLAFSLAVLAGCDPIVMVGQDLCFPGGQMYADASGWGGKRVEADGAHLRYIWDEQALSQDRGDAHLPQDEEGVMVPTVTGGQAPTVRSWDAMIKWFGHQQKAAGVTCYQTSPEGAAIAGFTAKRLGPLLAYWQPVDVPEPTDRLDISQAAVSAFLERERLELDAIIAKPEHARRTASVLFDPWAMPDVAVMMECRRHDPVGSVWEEYRRARLDRVKLNSVVREAAGELRRLL